MSLFVFVGLFGGMEHMCKVHCMCLSACVCVFRLSSQKEWSSHSCSTIYVCNYRVHVEENVALNQECECLCVYVYKCVCIPGC